MATYGLKSLTVGNDTYVINTKSRNFYNAEYKYSFFVNAPYEYNDNIYLMSLIDKNGMNLFQSMLIRSFVKNL